jgi:hypothetical protein
MKKVILLALVFSTTSIMGDNITKSLVNNYKLISNNQTCINSEDGTSMQREFNISKKELNITTKHYNSLDCDKSSFAFITKEAFLYKIDKKSSFLEGKKYNMDLVLIDKSIIYKDQSQVSTSHNIKLFTKFYILNNRLYIATPNTNAKSSYTFANQYLSIN